MKQHNARNFALQFGAIASLYISIIALISLLFSIVTLTIPDATDSVWTLEQAASSVRLAFATLIIFFPTFLLLTRRVNVMRRRENTQYLTITKWLIYVSLLIGGGVLLGDAVALIYSFLEGETTVRFVVKALMLAGIITAAFAYYLLDAHDYWKTHERYSLLYGATTSVVVVLSLIWGLNNIEPPAVVREMKIDTTQVGHLQDMQWRIEDHFRTNESLPTVLSDVFPAGDVPVSPRDNTAYTYTTTGESSYELCATFTTSSAESRDYYLAQPLSIEKNNNWDHPAGYWCYERVIDGEYRQ